MAFLAQEGITNVAVGTWDDCWELNILIPKEDG